MPTDTMIMAMIIIPPAPAGGCSGIELDAAMYAVNVGSCSTL